MQNLSIDPNTKILVFVMNPYALMNVKSVMSDMHITPYRLRGNNKVINTNITRFNKDDGSSKSLIICPMTANTGISLPKATDIIFFDIPTNTDLELRMIGRAQRLGRRQQLRVWNISYDFDILDRHRDEPTLQSVEDVVLGA
jgi:superfamily II DNA/RNA helicase